MDYGKNIEVGKRVELHPSKDLWMRGARFGEVTKMSDLDMIAHVKMDHPEVTKIQKIAITSLKLA